MQKQLNSTKIWIARLLIALVTVMNLQAAFQFMLRPHNYAWGFELSGTPGSAILKGMGLLFLMWNIPYIFAAFHPVKNFVSLIEALMMQLVGVAGETILLSQLPGGHPIIHASVMRFIVFDAAGLLLLLIAFCLCLKQARQRKKTVKAEM